MDQLQELRSLIVRHARGGIRRDLIDGVSIGVVESTTAPAGVMTQPSMTLLAGGRKKTSIGDIDLEYGPGEFLVASIELPVTGYVISASPDDPFVVFSMTLEPAHVAALVLDAGPASRTPAPRGIAVSEAPSDLLDAVTRLLRVATDPRDARVLGAAARREVLWRLLTGTQGALVRQIGVADSGVSRVALAIAWMRANLAEPISVAQLADLSRMSPSAFHRHFRAVTNLTPIQWQKAARLRTARAQLLADRVSIADAGYAVGYGSASQFSRDYRRAFGLPPGRDAQRIRDRGGDLPID